MKQTVIVLVLAAAPFSCVSHAIEFTPGNIVVSNRVFLREFTPEGLLVQSLEIPHPDFPVSPAHQIGDMAFDGSARLHMLNEAISSSGQDYLTTLDLRTGQFSHTPMPLDFDGGLSISGNFAFNAAVRMNLLDMTYEIIDYDLVVGTAEATVGLDGVLYAYNTGSPRHEMRRVDPQTLTFIDADPISLRQEGGRRTNARGINATLDGDIYVADWNGKVYQYGPDVQLETVLQTGAGNNHNIDIRHDGLIVVGNRFGNISVTDVDFSFLRSIDAGQDWNSFVTFVPVPEPDPLPLVVCGCLLTIARMRWFPSKPQNKGLQPSRK